MTPRPSATDLIVDALAVARLTHLAQQDEVWPMREAREAYTRRTEGSRWQDLAHCAWCGSIWFAALVALLRWRFPRAWPILARVLAASQVTGVLAEHGH